MEVGSVLARNGLLPHGVCFSWQPDLLITHVVADSLIFIAYLVISCQLIYFVRRRQDLVFKPAFWLFGTFILGCGITHFLGILVIWKPEYWLDGIAKAVTAIASMFTALFMFPLLPKALALPSHTQLSEANRRLQMEIDQRRQVEEALRVEIEERKAALTLLEETQMQLLQSEKLAALGQLAAGVAHEVNTPIAYVTTNLKNLVSYIDDVLQILSHYEQAEPQLTAEARGSIVQLKTQLDVEFIKQDVPSLLLESKNGIERVQAIVRHLKDFSRIDMPEDWHWSDIHSSLDSTLTLLSHVLHDNILIHKEYAPHLPQVECLGSQINQVILNLLLNARQAIEHTGDIWIRTGSSGNEIFIEISDNGKGIAPEHIARIFEPFFTTKPVGQGTGLGLSTSYGIIQKHGGRIEVSSAMQRTTFRICLPVQRNPANGK